jgi:hypothetical protein
MQAKESVTEGRKIRLIHQSLRVRTTVLIKFVTVY